MTRKVSPKKGHSEAFDAQKLLTGRKAGQSRLQVGAGETIYAQGDPADAMFYVETGWVKITHIGPNGKEAIVAIRQGGDFFGSRCLVARRAGAAVALTPCSLIRVTTSALIRLLREEPAFAVMFTTYLVQQAIGDQESLVDHLTNPAEKRLARTLLQLAAGGGDRDPQPIPAPISQAVLASMIGTTRPRINFFMNKFKRLGFIDYDRDRQIGVRASLRTLIET